MLTRDLIKLRIPNGEAFLHSIQSDPELHSRVVFLEPDAELDDGDLGLKALSLFMRRQTPDGAVGRALRSAYVGLGKALGFLVLRDQDVPRRPYEEGLLTAALALIEALERASGRLPQSLPFDPSRARFLIDRIQLKRDIARSSASFVLQNLRTLTVEENELFKMVEQSYGLVRELALADPVLAPILEATEDYLFGPAARAAETRQRNARQMEGMEKKAEGKAMVEAEKKVRTTLTEELTNLVQEITRLRPLSRGEAGDADEGRRQPR